MNDSRPVGRDREVPDHTLHRRSRGHFLEGSTDDIHGVGATHILADQSVHPPTARVPIDNVTHPDIAQYLWEEHWINRFDGRQHLVTASGQPEIDQITQRRFLDVIELR